MHKEKTLVLLKPDAIQRGLIGKITDRLELTGLKIIAMKMVKPNEEIAKTHYPLDEKWAESLFQKTKTSYERDKKEMKYKTPFELGQTIQSWLVRFITESPVIAMVLEGPHAVELVRKLIGSTEPRQALPGTIRGDFSSVESYAIGDKNSRTVRNLIHASDSVENAKREIAIWFSEKEIHNYQKDLDRHF
jgi:nucleoside-diphosphate kinase